MSSYESVRREVVIAGVGGCGSVIAGGLWSGRGDLYLRDGGESVCSGSITFWNKYQHRNACIITVKV